MTKKAKPDIDPEVQKSLEAAIDDCNKTYGDQAVILGEGHPQKVDVIPTGNILVDVATGVGGLPRGRTVEIYGPFSSGKTTTALMVIAQAQKMGGIAAFIDAEHALDLTYAEKLGVKTNNLVISQPNSGEEALEITEKLVRSGVLWIVVIDSVAALVPKAELEGEIGEFQVGLQARLMSQALRKLTAAAYQTNTLIIFLNQLRMKIGGYGNPETTAGGESLKYYTSMRFDCRQVGKIKEGEEIIGVKSRITVAKNKLARPYQSAEFDILFGIGHDKIGILLDCAIGMGIVIKEGNTYSYNGEKLGVGLGKAREALINTSFYNPIEEQVRKVLTKE